MLGKDTRKDKRFMQMILCCPIFRCSLLKSKNSNQPKTEN